MSLSKVPMRACALLVMVLPLCYLNSGCSFLPTAARRAGSEAATGALEVTEAKLRDRWESTWKPALVAEAKKSAADLAGSVRDMIAAQGESYKADLAAKIADGTATRTERVIWAILSALGLAGAGKGFTLARASKAALAAVVHGVEAHTSGLPATLLGVLEGKLKEGVDAKEIGSDLADALKGTIKSAATKTGVGAALYKVVEDLTSPKT